MRKGPMAPLPPPVGLYLFTTIGSYIVVKYFTNIFFRNFVGVELTPVLNS